MSEIKFACPHCQQHIACDSDFADMTIVCPSCGQPMVVPALSATAPAHPDLRLVASLPSPRRPGVTMPPPLDPWTREQWAQHPSLRSEGTPAWIICVLLTFIAAAVLKATGVHAAWSVAVIAVGCVISGILMAKRTTFLPASGDYTDVEEVFEGILGDFVRVGIWILLLPVLGLGLLFIGCAACH